MVGWSVGRCTASILILRPHTHSHNWRPNSWPLRRKRLSSNWVPAALACCYDYVALVPNHRCSAGGRASSTWSVFAHNACSHFRLLSQRRNGICTGSTASAPAAPYVFWRAAKFDCLLWVRRPRRPFGRGRPNELASSVPTCLGGSCVEV